MADAVPEADFVQESPSIFAPVSYLFANYGWHMLVVGIILTYIYQKSIKSHLIKYQKDKEEADYAAKYHKNPDLLSARVSAQQAHAAKLQEKYRRDAEEHQRKLEEKEARKRQELLEKVAIIGGVKLGSESKTKPDESKPKKSFKPEYNPLMGSGGSSNYRPPKRSACGGGGCG